MQISRAFSLASRACPHGRFVAGCELRNMVCAQARLTLHAFCLWFAGAYGQKSKLFFPLLAFAPFPEAMARVFSFGALHHADQVRVRRRPSLLGERGVTIKFTCQESVMFSERRQFANDLIEASVEIQEMLVNSQFHSFVPRAWYPFAAGAVMGFVRPRASALDVMVGISWRGGAAVMTFLTLTSRECKAVLKLARQRQASQRVKQEDEESRQRNELKTSFGELVIFRRRGMAARADCSRTFERPH